MGNKLLNSCKILSNISSYCIYKGYILIMSGLGRLNRNSQMSISLYTNFTKYVGSIHIIITFFLLLIM